MVENTYPGVRYDTPANVYQSTFPFHQTRNGRKNSPKALGFENRWQGLARKHDVYRYLKLSCCIEGIEWDGIESMWVWPSATSSPLRFIKRRRTLHWQRLAISTREDSQSSPEYNITEDWFNTRQIGKDVFVIGNGANGVRLVSNLQN